MGINLPVPQMAKTLEEQSNCQAPKNKSAVSAWLDTFDYNIIKIRRMQNCIVEYMVTN
jgi:hypothetical protein